MEVHPAAKLLRVEFNISEYVLVGPDNQLVPRRVYVCLDGKSRSKPKTYSGFVAITPSVSYFMAAHLEYIQNERTKIHDSVLEDGTEVKRMRLFPEITNLSIIQPHLDQCEYERFASTAIDSFVRPCGTFSEGFFTTSCADDTQWEKIYMKKLARIRLYNLLIESMIP